MYFPGKVTEKQKLQTGAILMEKSNIFSLEKSQLQFTGKTGIFLEKSHLLTTQSGFLLKQLLNR